MKEEREERMRKEEERGRERKEKKNKKFLFLFLFFVLIHFSEVGNDYVGPHLVDGQVTEKFMTDMIEHFKNEKKIHKKYAYQILVAAKKFFR